MTATSFSLDQCLFGYQEGHRLLASSIKLGDQAALLTEMSDLAPGTLFADTDGYWTGFPVPKLGRYALLRTWPAPEMPRPGCVWTHALLINPDDLARIPDLSDLRDLMRRPKSAGDEALYRDTLETVIADPGSPGDLSELEVSMVLEALYGSRGPIIHVSQPGAIDNELFATWSQQWPRLRRNLRFQTAASRDSQSATGFRFDIVVRLATQQYEPVRDPRPQWLTVAGDDVMAGAGAQLRAFLWQYGEGVRRQRGSFRPLTEIWLLGTHGKATAEMLLQLIGQAFPEQADALMLKQHLTDGLLFPELQLKLLNLALAGHDTAVMPPPSQVGIERLSRLWPTRSADLLQIAEQAVEASTIPDDDGSLIFETITQAIPPTEFWDYTAGFPKVQRRMVDRRPELLLAPSAERLDTEALVTFVKLITDREDIVLSLLPRLLPRDDATLVKTMIQLFPKQCAAQTILAKNGGTTQVGQAWFRAVLARPDVLLSREIFKHISRTSLLYEIGEALGWLTAETARAGTDPWIAALENITSDLPDEKRDNLRAFMVALALAAPGDGARRVLEQFFGYVHWTATHSRLSWTARDILRPTFTDAGWAWGMDFAWRLRRTVADTYIKNGYPPASFARLVKQKKAREQLADAAAALSGGKPYAQAINSR